MKIRLLDLFSGIGGFHLGLEKAGFEVEAYFSEIDKYAIDVYSNNFKNATYVGSVRNVQSNQLPRIDAITFGSPCQDFSLAGKRKGLDGERSSLITEAIRLIEECRPRFFVWENVKGTFSSNNREDFAAILQAFANIGGYRLEWQLLNTKWFLPQNRERIYLVGYLGGRSGQQIFPIGKNDQYTNGKIGKEVAQTLDTHCNQAVIGYTRDLKGKVVSNHEKDECNTLHSASGQGGNTDQFIKVGLWRTHKDGQGFREVKDGNSPTIPARAREDGSGQPVIQLKTNYTYKKVNETIEKNRDSFIKDQPKMMDLHNRSVHDASPCLVEPHHNNASLFDGIRIRRLTPVECERLQGFPDNWTAIGKEKGQISDTQRYKMCGNAVTVDVVKAVATNIKKVIFSEK